MQAASLQHSCDRLSHAVDAHQFERLRWARDDGPVLTRLIDLTQAAIEARVDFELTDEGSANGAKRYVLKVHSKRIVAFALWLDGGRAHIQTSAIDRSPYRLIDGPALSAAYDAVDAAWVDAALQSLFDRVQA